MSQVISEIASGIFKKKSDITFLKLWLDNINRYWQGKRIFVWPSNNFIKSVYFDKGNFPWMKGKYPKGLKWLSLENQPKWVPDLAFLSEDLILTYLMYNQVSLPLPPVKFLSNWAQNLFQYLMKNKVNWFNAFIKINLSKSQPFKFRFI